MRPVFRPTTQEWQPDIIEIKLGTNDASQDNGNWKGKATFKTAKYYSPEGGLMIVERTRRII